MRTSSSAIFAIIAWAMVVPMLPAAPPARPVDVRQLQVWLDQLDDESYARREQATQRLHAAGEQAIDVLAQGALSEIPETAWRAGEALKRIAVSGNEKTIDRVAEALERVGKQGRSGMTQVVKEIRARQKQLRHDRAAAQIRRLGGGLSGGMSGFGGEMMVDVGFFPVAAPAVIEVEVLAEARLEVARAVEAAAAAAEAGVEAKVAADEAAEVAIAAERAAKAAAKAAAEPAAKEVDALPAAPAVEFKEVTERAELSLEFGEGQRVETDEPALEPADELDEFRELARLPLGAEEPAEFGEAIAIDDIELVAADPFAMPAAGVFFDAGGAIVELDPEAGYGAQSLVLNANWRGGDEGLAALRDLPDVTMISINDAKLGDAALKHIAALPKLSNISIRGTVFSVAALRALHKAKPGAHMFCQGEAMVGIHADSGASCVLTSVYGGSGAADAGLREGDKIVAIDDVPIRDFAELTISVYGRQVGDKLKIEYERDGKRHTAQVELKARSVLEP